ncbi:thioesterase II family protein [Paenibacillus agilis]|uniref:Thioesterase n=1 Tax=Paenibacillus agilis TaxID=3020863 RepID=A0A559J0F6_9BACL|nr:thioesterase domain-containing protein [Paenibacillus agilis]TVX93375.1 thioesterase [Paenibacillus agilis]
MRLYCLPFAGGSKRAYSHWNTYTSHALEIEGVELKGRGEKFGQGFYHDISEAVDDIYSMIKDKIRDEKYALFGHSMGTLLAYELYYKIIEEGHPRPQHIFFSGRQSPIVHNNMYVNFTMSDDEFISKIIALGGIHEELTQSKELMRFYLPILKNDIRIMETYEFKERPERLKCKITVLNGLEDKIDTIQKITWDDLCEQKSKSYYFTGSHFFINDHVEQIVKLFEGVLCQDNEVGEHVKQ